jgi:hypothetical protein
MNKSFSVTAALLVLLLSIVVTFENIYAIETVATDHRLITDYSGENKCQCPLPESADFTNSERWAWNERICLGLPANMWEFHQSPLDYYDTLAILESIKPHKKDKEGEARAKQLFFEILSAISDPDNLPKEFLYKHILRFLKLIDPEKEYDEKEMDEFIEVITLSIKSSYISRHFLKTITSQSPYNTVLLNNKIKISGAFFAEGIDLEYSNIEPSLFITGSIVNSVAIIGAKFDKTLSFSGSVVGKFDGDSIKVGGYFFLHGGAVFKDNVILRGANIGGNLETIGSTFEGKFDGDGLEVGRSLFLRGGAVFKDNVILRGANIGGNLETIGSTFEGKFDGDSIKVEGYLFLRGGAVFKDEVNLMSSHINDSIQLQGSRFEKDVCLTDAIITKELVLGRNKVNQTNPQWGPKARLLLNNTTAGAIQDSLSAWYVEGTKKFVPTDLRGFRYHRIGGYSHYSDEDRAESDNIDFNFEHREVEWLKSWLASQIGHDKNFTPGPYRSLADILNQSGQEEKARKILIAIWDYKRTASNTPRHTKLSLVLQKYFFNYGYSGSWILIWWSLLVLCYAMLLWFLYSSSHLKTESNLRNQKQPNFLDFLLLSSGYAIPLARFETNINPKALPLFGQALLFTESLFGIVCASLFMATVSGLVR